MCLNINAPDLSACAAWLGCDVAMVEPMWAHHRGDLRKLKQWNTGCSTASSNDISRPMTVQDLVMHILRGELNSQDDLHLDNNDLNLTGLHLHETLPDWIREHYGSNQSGWNIYSDCLTYIATSDRQDYYTFFHQHWSLFPLSFQSKLQSVNHRLFVTQRPAKIIPPSVSGSPGKGWKFQYTAVLARQSWLFNQFKYLCELRDMLQSSPVRDGGLEIALWIASLVNKTGSEAMLHSTGPMLTAKPTVSKDRIQRWLKTLTVPTIPPCPIGKV
jgi:hypothetical protein